MGFSKLLSPVCQPVTGQAQLVWRVLRKWRGQWDIFIPKADGEERGLDGGLSDRCLVLHLQGADGSPTS